MNKMSGPHARKGTGSRWKWIAPSELGDLNAGNAPKPPRHVRIRLRAVMSPHLPALRPSHVRKGRSVMNRLRVMILRRDQILRPNVLSLSNNGRNRRPNALTRNRSVLNPRPSALSLRSVQILRRVQNLLHPRVCGRPFPAADTSCEHRSQRQTIRAIYLQNRGPVDAM